MFISPTVIRHGINALEKEIDRLKTIQEECGGEWTPDFDPNDIWVYDSVLRDFYVYKDSGYDEQNLKSKPFRFFVALIPGYIKSNIDDLTQESYLELLHLYSEIIGP